MTAKKPLFWQLPAVIAGGMAALTAIGGGIVMASRYIELPPRLEAAEKKNAEQDQAINRLAAVEETWQKIYQQQQQAARPSVEEQSDNGEIKVLKIEGKKLCCDGRECWPWSKKTQCQREDE